MSLSIKILGSNSASFAHNRHQTSQIVQVQNQFFMIDCGEGTQLQCKKYGVKLSKIDHILISHLHGDHYYGLMGLLSTMHLYGREKDLKLVCPPGLSDIISIQLRYSQSSLNYHIDYIEWEEGVSSLVIENKNVTIHTIPLNHKVPCSGYLIREKPKRRRINQKAINEKLTASQVTDLKEGRDILNKDGSIRYNNNEVTLPPLKPYSYAYCSDTKFSLDLTPYIEGVDILYHEATFMEDMADRALNTYHSTAAQAGKVALDAKIGKLLIGHFSTRYNKLEPILYEAQQIFPNTFLAIEGEVFNISQ